MGADENAAIVRRGYDAFNSGDSLRWLAPGGRLALIDSLPDPQSGAVDHASATGDRSVRRLADGRAFTIVKVFRTPDEVAAALRAAGFDDVAVTTTGRFFLLATAVRP